jgi:8-oxo-dGTP pyrophosphatase MutT (NUDIX family)
MYAERGNQILLLKRAAQSPMAGSWFLPGGAVEPREPPEMAAIRELREESGLEVAEEPEPIGCYYSWEYGHDFLHLSFRARVREGEVVVNEDHDAATWVDPRDMRRAMSDETIAGMAKGDARTEQLLRGIRDDLDKYLRRTHEARDRL